MKLNIEEVNREMGELIKKHGSDVAKNFINGHKFFSAQECKSIMNGIRCDAAFGIINRLTKYHNGFLDELKTSTDDNKTKELIVMVSTLKFMIEELANDYNIK